MTQGPEMYAPRMDAFLNRWFTSYEKAKEAHRAGGGYLFPYRHQFFTAEAGAIHELGLDPADPDWERIGYDWVRPDDAAAWERLAIQRQGAVMGPRGSVFLGPASKPA